MFHIAFQAWIQDGETRTFEQIGDESMEALKVVTATG